MDLLCWLATGGEKFVDKGLFEIGAGAGKGLIDIGKEVLDKGIIRMGDEQGLPILKDGFTMVHESILPVIGDWLLDGGILIQGIGMIVVLLGFNMLRFKHTKTLRWGFIIYLIGLLVQILGMFL